MPQKFTFDVSFDHLDVGTERSFSERRFTRTELEATRQAALAEGHAAGLAESARAEAALTAESLAAIARGIGALIAAQDAVKADTQRRAMSAMQAIFAKVFPALAAKGALAEVEAFAAKCLDEAIGEPRVVLRVANEIYAPLRERIDALAAAAGYDGRIVLIADDALAGGDARVEWADGGAERSLAAQAAEIDALINRRSDSATTPTALTA